MRCTCGVDSDFIGGPHESFCARTLGGRDSEDDDWIRYHAELDAADRERGVA